MGYEFQCGLTSRRGATVLQDLYLWERSPFLTLEGGFPKGKEILTTSEGRILHLREAQLLKDCSELLCSCT